MKRGCSIIPKESKAGQELKRLHQYLWSKKIKYPTTLDANDSRRGSRGEGAVKEISEQADEEDVKNEEIEKEEEGTAKATEKEDEKSSPPPRNHKC